MCRPCERNLALKSDVCESRIDPEPLERGKERTLIDRRKLTPRRSRPTIRLETYLRMVYRKLSFRLGAM